MRTLERKKSSAHRLANGGNGRIAGPPVPHQGQQNGSTGEKNEFDDLISALRTGDVFGENMDKFRRNRKARGSPPRVERMDSFLRERTTNHQHHYQPREK